MVLAIYLSMLCYAIALCLRHLRRVKGAMEARVGEIGESGSGVVGWLLCSRGVGLGWSIFFFSFF